MQSFHINPVWLIRSLSLALELTVDGLNTHHWRTGIICQYLSGVMQLSLSDKQTLFMAALLHDIGAASDFNERRTLLNPAWPAPRSIYNHAEEGWRLLDNSHCFRHLALAVRHHHDRWAGGNPSGAAGETIPLASRIIHVADNLEIRLDRLRPALKQCDDLSRHFLNLAGQEYDPAVIEALEQTARKDSFWLDLANPGYAEHFFKDMESWGLAHYTAGEMLNIAEMFAGLIDRMSVFTAHHSRSVSKVATLVAAQCSFSDSELTLMKTAGLLHDLGKLAIPREILEKPGKLTSEEMQLMRQHTYYTYRILQYIGQMETAAQWGAFHHETLDGAGYPFRLEAQELDLGSRIMAVADIFVALAESRPYRERLERAEVEKIMRGMAEKRKIDLRLVGVLFDVYAQADEIILGAEGHA